MYFDRTASTAEMFRRGRRRTPIASTKVLTRRIRRRCSSAESPEPTQATMAIGRRRHKVAVTANSLEAQPPHFRYQPNANSRRETQAAKRVTPTKSIRSDRGAGGRSGRMKRRTKGMASTAIGTLTQKIQRQVSQSLT